MAYDIDTNLLYQQMSAAKTLIQRLLCGIHTSGKRFQFVGSPPGYGKSSLVVRELRRVGLGSSDIGTARPTTAAALHAALWRHRDAKLLLLDDCDILAVDPGAADLGKMAFGSPPRIVERENRPIIVNEQRRQSGAMGYDPTIPPPRFSFTPAAIWLSNRNPNKMLEHTQAVLSRGWAPLWIEARTQVELFQYTVWLGSDGGMLRSLGFSRTHSQFALDIFVDRAAYWTEVTPRALAQLAEYVRGSWGNSRVLKALIYPLLHQHPQSARAGLAAIDVPVIGRASFKTDLLPLGPELT